MSELKTSSMFAFCLKVLFHDTNYVSADSHVSGTTWLFFLNVKLDHNSKNIKCLH